MDDTAALTAPPAPSRKRKSRGKGLRVRTGCHSCRSRHLKCGEERPSCWTCEKAARQCEYPRSPPSTASLDDRRGDAGQSNSNRASRDIVLAPSTVEDSAYLSSDRQPLGDPHPHLPVHHSFHVLGDQDERAGLQTPGLYGADTFETSPDSTWAGWANVSAEAATLSWFGLVATDAAYGEIPLPDPSTLEFLPSTPLGSHARPPVDSTRHPLHQETAVESLQYISEDVVELSYHERRLFEHFVLSLSTWIDVTDPDRSFAILVPQMALKNRGLMTAILALSARHVSLTTTSAFGRESSPLDTTSALQYYYETLRYLQEEMKNPAFLRSDELLATVLTISTYEMIDGSNRGWERHLKGVFWIQRSQTIHGESEGLKKCIWWAWLRQDLWVAFKERRNILSFYHLSRACSDLGFWELVNRAVWLLGQCVNYASSKEEDAGRVDIQARLAASASLWERLEQWNECFAKFDRRLPSVKEKDSAFEPIWVNPPAAALAIQVHHFSKILLFEYTPATGGLRELVGRQAGVQSSADTICGIACCARDDGISIVSTQCLFAAGLYVKETAKRNQVVALLQAHRLRTGWPQYDLSEELTSQWNAESGHDPPSTGVS